jgi:type I restriction enzyme R subunit
MPADPIYESERRTRAERIDPKLTAAGWTIVPYDESADPARWTSHAVVEYPTTNGPADYALFVAGQLVAVIEAKKVTLGPQGVLTQAERYAKGLANSPFDFRGLRAPFLFSTNGEIIHFHDVRHRLNLSRVIARFFTPAALAELLARDQDAALTTLQASPNEVPGFRPYQVEANHAVEDAIAKRKRQMLVAMATGTGKTFTTVNQVYRLMKSGVARRVLFLVDRRALAAQAVRSFAAFEPEPGLKFDKIYEVYSQRFQANDFGDDEKFDPKVLPNPYLTAPTPGLAFLYVSTIQRMAINLFGRAAGFAFGEEEPDDEVDQLDNIPIHAFDCIVADECHRGYTSSELSTWRNTLDHFDAIKVGLTATPAAHTKAYFNEVVYRYEYDRAVREGFLVDYNAVTVKSNVRLNGLFLREGDQINLVDPKTGQRSLDLLEDERQFDATQLERDVTAPESNRKVVEELHRYALEHQKRYGRFPKTLIFAVNDLPHTSHADQLVTICRNVFGQGDSFVRKITGRTDRPLQQIREFRNRPNPGVVVTVDMLSTGVDIPDLEFIVFLRPVKSRILFEQMLGRGTRKGDRFPDKSHFTVFDCFDGTLLQYFREASAFTRDPPDKPTRTFKQIIDDIHQNRDRDYNVRCLVKRLQRIDKEMSDKGRDQFAAFIPEGDMGRYARELPERLSLNFAATMQLLRDEAFQALLVNYHRPPRTFIEATEAEDEVTSEWLIRDGAGNEHKPGDYLAEFARYVQENPDHIEAVRILLDRPVEWSHEALSELRTKFATNRLRFTRENLERAHQAHYHKALIDVISMVKHAAHEAAPLYTAEERVDAALSQLTKGQTLSENQQRWLQRIRNHLVENLAVDPSDFDDMPVFSREGGWVVANRAFEGRLADLIRNINAALAA